MDLFWRLFGRGSAIGSSGLRRIIVLVIEGLDPALVDEFLEQGLLHHLALLTDVGGHGSLVDSALGVDDDSLGEAIGRLGVRAVELRPTKSRQSTSLAALCAADRQQQERLFAALARWRPTVVIGVFDLPARVKQLFGHQPDESQRLVLRDLYARMDEVIGKAFSFVDAQTVLLAVIRATDSGEVVPPSANADLVYANRQLTVSRAEHSRLDAIIVDLLRLPAP
jgi:hypothetical protein